jgi:Zn-dependent M28 family amino/carboxypeptidase
LKNDAFPLPFSANTTTTLKSNILPDVMESGDMWMLALYTEKDDANDAHFDYEKIMSDRAKEAKKQGASAVIFYDNIGSKYAPKFNTHTEIDPIDIPVAFISNETFKQKIEEHKEGVPVELSIAIRKSEFTGINVAAYIDNNAKFTAVIGAHFDHLGYGEPGSSLYAGKDKQVHNGADDNASGTAGLLQIAKWIKKDKLKNYNYLFVNFSAEELGLLGSKAFVKDMKLDSTTISYMINMDMIGRLNDSTHALTIGGVGTSPIWYSFIASAKKDFKVSLDSSGVGPSDHTSFYYAGIPVLFLFTGLHSDYHKPSDDADKINYKGEVTVLKYGYSIIKDLDKKHQKLPFTTTKQSTVGKVRFKVTLGIMPDYSFQDGGVRADGVSDDRPAQKAGIKAGDIIIQLGEFKVSGMQSYMEALGKFKAGQTITVTILRDGKQIQLPLTFQ